MAFLRNLLAVIVGLFIFSFLSFFFFIGIVASLESDEAPIVKENTILYLRLTGVLKEQTVEDPLEELFPNSNVQAHSLKDLLAGIRAAADDDKVRAMYLEPQYFQAGYASLQELRDVLIQFKESGKQIYAYGEYISESDYFLISVADKIFLNPQGSLEFNGLTASVTFYKGLFDKLGIEPEIFRVGRYKSAVEPLMQKQMSEENRLQLTELINSNYDHYLMEVSRSRGIDIDRLSEISSGMEAYMPEESAALGLVDKVAFEDEIKEEMRQLVEVEEVKDLNFMTVSSYVKTLDNNYAKDRIAFIIAEGEIVMGNSDDEVVAADRFVRELRKARENERVKAIVLRINSPGGSMTASDMIWREIQLTKEKKPIIASMGNYAASGGYYLAMHADKIIAQPTTITGSIGVFGMLFNLETFLEDKLGITNEVVSTGEFSDIITVTRPLNAAERNIIQRGVETSYNTFIEKVADGRGMPVEEIEKLASGRVWSGTQALEAGLVDLLGGSDTAIELAAEEAGLEEYQVLYYPVKKPFIEQFMGKISDEVETRISGKTNHLLKNYADRIEELSRMQGIQARMPAHISIN